MAAVRNIYEQQAYNKRMTTVLVILYIAVAVLVGYTVDVLVLGFPASNPLPILSLSTLMLACGTTIWSLSSGWIAVLKATGAVPANPRDPLHKKLLNIVEEVKIAAGLPMPRVYVIHDCDFNALATGNDPRHCAVAVTDSLLEGADRDELQGVVAHEMSHIKNYDIRLMTIIASLVGAIVLMGDSITKSLKTSIESATSDGSSTTTSAQAQIISWVVYGPLYVLIWFFTTIVAPLPLKIMAMAVSRNREYLADAAAAELTRNPAALAQVLKKVGTDRIPTFSMTRAAAHLCIVDPSGNGFNDMGGFLAELFGTHPPILKRIKRLEAMAYSASRSPQPPPQPAHT